MSKLLLIIDSDELNDDCLNCPVKYTYVGGVGCSIAHKDVETESIPDWCPLRPLPEREDDSDFKDSIRIMHEAGMEPEYWDGFTLGKIRGWNACLDAITGEVKV